MSRKPQALKTAACLAAFFLLSAGAAAGPPGRFPDRLDGDPLSPGVYIGTFVFTYEHTFNETTQEMPVNYYSLRAEDVMGTMRFSVNEDGAVPGISIRIPGFPYNVVYSQTVVVPEGSQGEYHCTGSSGYAAGVGSASGGSGSSGAAPLSSTPFDFYTKPIKLSPGDPWGRVSMTGKCPGGADSKKFTDGVKADFTALPASPWTFKATWQGFQSAGGTCSATSWQIPGRSFSCHWAAYSGGYKRKTAPGP